MARIDWFEQLTGFRESEVDDVGSRFTIDGEHIVSATNGRRMRAGGGEGVFFVGSPDERPTLPIEAPRQHHRERETDHDQSEDQLHDGGRQADERGEKGRGFDCPKPAYGIDGGGSIDSAASYLADEPSHDPPRGPRSPTSDCAVVSERGQAGGKASDASSRGY